MFSEFKSALTEVAVERLGPIGEEMQRLVADPDYIDGVLADGGARARAMSAPVLAEVYETVGLIQA
jgi:tryptophanyl-tRNA synthetase